MFILSRVFNLFRDSADADISEESSFKVAFSNVSNTLMLAQSLILGLRALVENDALLASMNLLFSLFFITYFVVMYVVKKDRYVNIMDRMAIFVYFIVVYITCTRYGFSGLTITIYPFIAMMLHGRHVGATLGTVQLGIILLYYIVFVRLFGIGETHAPSLQDTIMMTIAQVISIFIFYVALRWFTTLVYEKNREVSILTEERKMEGDLVNRLSHCVERPLRDISQASAILVSETMTEKQADLCNLIRTSTLNAINNVNAVRRASIRNIPLIPAELKVINITQLLGPILRVFRPKDPEIIHSFTLASNVPEEVRGNSILTRRVFVNTLDALEQSIKLSQSTLNLLVSRANTTSKGIELNFNFEIIYNFELDRREMSVSETHLIDFLGLNVTKRIVESEGGTFVAVHTGKGINIDFTIHYRAIDEDDGIDIEIINNAKKALQTKIQLSEAVILVMTENDLIWARLSSALESVCAATIRTKTVRDAVKAFSDRKVNAIFTDLTSDNAQGPRLVPLIRDAESGMVRNVPIIDLIDPRSDEQLSASVHANFDKTLHIPLDTNAAVDTLRSLFV